MGAGKKTTTLHLKEKGVTSWTTNGSAPARNLRKSDLGGVIFGCKNNTIDECHAKLLFGLPAPHRAYVKNIRPPMPLFLFNYSDRNLHGIYEAISPGDMDIDPYAWTADSAGHTPYGAQVRIKIRTQCSPLSEDEFKPVIAKNYYESKLFWFELDQAQTNRLISMFTSRTIVPHPLNMARRQTTFTTLNGGQRKSNAGVQVSRTVFAPLDNTNMGWGGSWDALGHGETEKNGLHQKSGRSYAAIVGATGTTPLEKISFPSTERKWSSLFESSTTNLTITKEEGGVSSSDVPLQSGEKEFFEVDNSGWASGKYDVEKELSEADNFGWATGKNDVEKELFEADNSRWASENYNSEWAVQTFDTSFEAPTAPEEVNYSNLPWLGDDAEWGHPSDMTVPACHISSEVLSGSNKGHDGILLCSDEGWSSASQTIPQRNGDGQKESFADETYDKISLTAANTECSYSNAVVEMNYTDNDEEQTVDPAEMVDEVHWGDTYSSEIVAIQNMASPDVQASVDKLMEEIEAMKVSQQIMQRELVESKAELQLLKTKYHTLEPRLLSSIEAVEEAITDSSSEPGSVINDSILIVGGFDGSSWLPDLFSFFPSEDCVRSLAPMSIVRKYSSAVAMNGEIFVLGGAEADLWQNTVDSYNPFTDQWSSCPPLNQKKGSLAGASLFNRIYAVGGGDGKECFSNVEMLDVNMGKWIPTRSMVHKRFAPAAAELNGAIYVVGGFDGKNYLSSAERFDPREHSWTSLRNMGTKRGCHSLTVLNDKLYALGGYDGANMVSSTEIFDPRLGSWMRGESMNSPRGYCGAAVLGEKIHIIGGTTENDEILETIELYEEGRGWEMTHLKAVGRRCFISAIVV